MAAEVRGVEPAGVAALPVAGVRTKVRVPLRFPDGWGTDVDVFTFTGLVDGKEHLALGVGDYAGAEVPLVRPHSECLTGDVFGSQRCDCGPQLREAVERIGEAGGYLLYLRQEGRGSASTRNSTPMRCRTTGSTPMRRTSRWGMARTSATTAPPRRCWPRSAWGRSGC